MVFGPSAGPGGWSPPPRHARTLSRTRARSRHSSATAARGRRPRQCSTPTPPPDWKPRRRAQRPPRQVWQAVISCLGVVALLSVCGLSSFFIVADERQGRDAIASGAAPPTAVPRDIGSREADPEPLSAAEVFPGEELAIDPTQPAYRVLRTSAGKDCRRAAAGRVAGLLRELGCTQVVRGTLRSSDGQYLVTAGVFNLSDVEGAEWAREKIKPMVEAGQGRFHGLLAGRGTEAIALSSAQVGWHVRGHYLVYCVVARADRKPIADGDQRVGQILTDLLETHLRGTVIEKRATAPVSGS